MYQKTSLWLIAILVSSVPQAYAGRPSAPAAPQPSQPPAPANSPSPSPATPAQPSGTPPGADGTPPQQPGFLSTPVGQATAVGGGIIAGVVGIGAAVKLGTYGYGKYNRSRHGGGTLSGQAFEQHAQKVLGGLKQFQESMRYLENNQALMEKAQSVIDHLSSDNRHQHKEEILEALQVIRGNIMPYVFNGLKVDLHVLHEHYSRMQPPRDQ